MALATLTSETHALPHVAVFPFMAKGHTIPLIHLVHHLRRRRLGTVTFFTTPGNAAFIRGALSGTDAAIVEIPFPGNVPGLPPGVESAEGLPSMAAFAVFAEAVSLLRPQFEASLASLQPPVSLLVADAFHYWTNESAARLGVPTVSFLGMSAFAHIIRELRERDYPCAVLLRGVADGVPTPGTFTVPEFPHVQLTLADLIAPFGDPATAGPMLELDVKLAKAMAESHGLIINTFYHLESQYVEYWNRHIGPKAWPVGPLCLSRPPTSEPSPAKPSWMEWLDEKAAAGRPVLYVALGTLAAVPDEQLKQVADGLDRAGVDFLWAVQPKDIDLGPGFEERVKERGIVVREWLDQWAAIHHKCIRGFLSHCGWNSVLESVAAGVPLAVWPMNADQPLNARLVVDELKVGVRVWTSDGTLRGLVTGEEVARAVTELMSGEAGWKAARNVAVLGAVAREAVSDGGTSWKSVEEMVSELCAMDVNGNAAASREEAIAT